MRTMKTYNEQFKWYRKLTAPKQQPPAELTFEQYCAMNEVVESPTEKQLQAIYNMQRGFKLPIEAPTTKEQATLMIGTLKHQIAEIKLQSHLSDDLYDSMDNDDWENNDWLDPIY